MQIDSLIVPQIHNFWGEDWSRASSPFLSQTRALSCSTISLPLFLHSSLSQSGMCQVSQLHTFRGRGGEVTEFTAWRALVSNTRGLSVFAPWVLGLAWRGCSATHSVHISVGACGKDLCRLCSSLSLHSQQSAVKTAEEGGVVRLVTHLENYCNTDTGEHMYCTERYCSSVSFIFIVSFHLAYPDSWKALCVSCHSVYEQLNFNSAQVEGENILMHDSTNQWQKFASYMKSYTHKP